MLFYINEQFITSAQSIVRNVIIAQSHDMINMPVIIKNGKYILQDLHCEHIFIPIYIYPLFNLNNLNRQLLIIYSYKNKSYRFIRTVSDTLYSKFTQLSIQHDHIKQPLLKLVHDQTIFILDLYHGLYKQMVSVQELNSNYVFSHRLYKLQYLSALKQIFNVDISRSLSLTSFLNEYDKKIWSISIFGNIYYLYSFVNNLLPDMITRYKQNWLITSDTYYNNTFSMSYNFDSYQVSIPFLSFSSLKKAQAYLDKLRAKLAFIQFFQ